MFINRSTCSCAALSGSRLGLLCEGVCIVGALSHMEEISSDQSYTVDLILVCRGKTALLTQSCG